VTEAATPAGLAVRWFDHHCHLEPGPPGAAAVRAAVAAGVARLITVGTDAERSAEAAAVARAHPGAVWATAGIHPHEASRGGVEVIEALQADDVVVAVGECGLDYHYDHSPRPVQRDVFAAQVALANGLQRPLVIHSRAAWDDTFAVLADVGVPDRLVFHCFSGGPAEAERCLAIGGHLSFSGIVTFKTAEELREAARRCPLDRLLVETDAPYLAPVPRRGRRNEPANLVHTAAALAAVRATTVEELSAATWESTNRFYGLDG
jgi:TatD DNase family protein